MALIPIHIIILLINLHAAISKHNKTPSIHWFTVGFAAAAILFTLF